MTGNAATAGPTGHEHSPDARLAHRTLVITSIAVGLGLLMVIAWLSSHLLLVLFGGILLAVALRYPSDFLARYTHMPPALALAIFCTLLLTAAVAGFWLMGAQASEQIASLAQRLPQSAQTLQREMEKTEWGTWLLSLLPEPDEINVNRGKLFWGASGFILTTFNVGVEIILVLFVGLYLAISPDTYVEGLLYLFPVNRRTRLRAVLHATGDTLAWWLVGKLGSMSVVAGLTLLGLWLLGVPLAGVLAAIAGLMTFIPNFGPLIALVPALLVSVVISPWLALWVIVLNVAIQAVETYVITPNIEKRTVLMPPALLISAQVLLGVLLGALGLIFAAPLTAAGLVLIKRLYIEDALGTPAPS